MSQHPQPYIHAFPTNAQLTPGISMTAPRWSRGPIPKVVGGPAKKMTRTPEAERQHLSSPRCAAGTLGQCGRWGGPPYGSRTCCGAVPSGPPTGRKPSWRGFRADERHEQVHTAWHCDEEVCVLCNADHFHVGAKIAEKVRASFRTLPHPSDRSAREHPETMARSVLRQRVARRTSALRSGWSPPTAAYLCTTASR